MEDNKKNIKFSIASLILGIVSLIPVLLLLTQSFIGGKTIFFNFFSIPGLILGIYGLKSGEKKISIGGIISSVLGLVSLVILFFVRLGFEGM